MLTSDLVARKSQIAIEYSYRLRVRSPQTWVFWVHASNTARFEQSYREIANSVKLPGRDDPKADIPRLVYEWLRDEANGSWLMILDNADDPNLFVGQRTDSSTNDGDTASSGAPLSSFLPQTLNGSIVVTSRNQSAAFKLVGDLHHIIIVEPMDARDGMELLRAKTPIDTSTEKDAEILLKSLEYVPLAITQAAAYINVGATRMTIQKYLAFFHENEATRTRLLDQDAGDLRRDPMVPNAVITAWQISFDQIRKDQPLAAELFSLMNVLDRQGIPEFLLLRSYDDAMDFEDALRPLTDFSLITAEIGREAFDMHALVQLAMRKWLTVHGELERWQRESVRIISETFPAGKYENWKVCEALEPHAQTVLRYPYVVQHCRLERANVLHNSAWYAWARGNNGAASDRVREASNIYQDLLGLDDHYTLGSLSLSATVLAGLGHSKEAEKLDIQGVEIRKRMLGQEHPETLTSMNNLAGRWREQGQLEKAEELHMQVVEMSKRVLGQEHPDTLTGMQNLAWTWKRQGYDGKALTLMAEVVQLRKKVLGPDHPHTEISIRALEEWQAQDLLFSLSI